MFSRVIPSWEHIQNFKQPLTEGEIYLLKFLAKNLKRDANFKDGDDLADYNGWLIFVQPFLNGCRPDIIIFNPNVGVQIIEVKDWNLDNYSYKEVKYKNRSEWNFCVSDHKGTYEIKSPVKQVEHYKDKLLGQLIPQIGEKIDRNEKYYGLIKTSIYFHKSTTEKAQDLFKDKELKKKNFKYFPIFGKDLLIPEKLRQIIPDSYLGKSYWAREWNNEILFWLNPPFHSIEQGIELTLNAYQEKFAKPQTGHFRIRGVAGSGKTQVLAYRAGSLASQGYRVLILSFNITLWHYIRDMIQRTPFEFKWDSFTLNHFHGFCKDILNEFDEKWPNGNDEGLFMEIVPKRVLEVIKRGSFEKYDAILIDEGQDYCIEWYKMLCEFLTQRDELVVVCDKKQNIYNRDMGWLDKRRSGVEKFGDWLELKTTIRLPEKIAKMTKDFSEKFNLNQDVKINKIERPNLFNQYIEHLVWWNIEQSEWLKKVDEAFETIKGKGSSKHASDTVILLYDKNFGLECVKHFETTKNMEINHVFENEAKEDEKYHKQRKKAFWMGDSRLKISTIHSFKGWEVLNVILYIHGSRADNVDEVDMLVYTAMTRTRQNLIVINANERYKAFGEGLPKSWG
ncbi:MAG: UvrD-helicase domain-containing protein [Campylobacteraceae bacterium]|jgi:superfamily I DNA/RNA helicase|nr:UvrD-helicase domain-containing protein [Campylobacteraceae bacterium]